MCIRDSCSNFCSFAIFSKDKRKASLSSHTTSLLRFVLGVWSSSPIYSMICLFMVTNSSGLDAWKPTWLYDVYRKVKLTFRKCGSKQCGYLCLPQSCHVLSKVIQLFQAGNWGAVNGLGCHAENSAQLLILTLELFHFLFSLLFLFLYQFHLSVQILF